MELSDDLLQDAFEPQMRYLASASDACSEACQLQEDLVIEFTNIE